MSSTKPAIYLGLDGIYVKETEISYIDGIHGKLYYRGYPIETLVEKSNFEEVTFLLLYGRLPKKAEFLEIFNKAIKSYYILKNLVEKELEKVKKSFLDSIASCSRTTSRSIHTSLSFLPQF